MVEYPSSHQHTSTEPAEGTLRIIFSSEPLQNAAALDDFEASERHQSVWSDFFGSEGRPQANTLQARTVRSWVLQQLSALKQKLLSRMQRMWAAASSAWRRINRKALYNKFHLPREKSQFENRVLRCLEIYPAGRAIKEFHSPKELLLALRDAIRAHCSLYTKGKILHRDISENNIIITDPKLADGYSGMLIDLDLAKELGSGGTGARHQTDTMEFMAIEVLRNIDHTYRHDLESFFYVLIWQCARNSWKRSSFRKDKPEHSLLKEWYTGSFEKIANAKVGRMGAKGLECICCRSFHLSSRMVKSLCRELRRILFPIHQDDILTGTPVRPEVLYDPIIQAFDKAIEDQGRALN
ncbi:hypothetical protein ACJ73_08673 [Blastomyces percursus]|uniref:EKC/KEOPS complex subunit BUD32 n=1 Tax=Blastomyces percursus TaxID=1658174 RepID=A0A1J9PS09_9EURO|nr:hypothetical protein ACJ73_08673 [Blastomyces percursus]